MRLHRTVPCLRIVDVGVSGVSIWAAGAAGGKIGAFVGNIYPGIGNLVGAVSGVGIGIVIYVLTDMTDIKGKTVREWAKEGAGSIW